jgi:hypothetical protein
MREQLAAWNSVVGNLMLVGVCAAIGVVGLPLAFGIDGGGATAWTTAIWLVAAIIVSLPILWFTRPLGDALGLAWDRGLALPSQSRLVARLLMLGLALIITQASLRRPLALMLGGTSSAAVEAAIAALALATVLALLVWVYETARPMLQALTLRALDAAIPTVNAPSEAEPTRTMSVAEIRPIPSPTDAATLRVAGAEGLTGRPLGAARGDEATVRATRADEPPLGAPGRGDEPTVRASRDDEPTLHVPRDEDPTVGAARQHEPMVRASREDEGTLLLPRDDDPTVMSPREP